MPQLGQAQTGSLRSTPKQLKMTASDKAAAVYKNMGNNHNVPFIWSASATVASGTTEVVIADGLKFYDMDLASYAVVTATPTSDPGDNYWLDHDTSGNVIKLVVGTTAADSIEFNVMFMLGAPIDVSTLSTRGSGAPAQSYP